MIDLNVMFSTLNHELPHYNSSMFLLGGLYIYLAVLFTKNISSKFAKIFTFLLGIFFLYETLSSRSILFNEMFYFAIGILYTQQDLFIRKKPVKIESRVITKYVNIDNSELKSTPANKNFLDGNNSCELQQKLKCETQKKQTLDELLEEMQKF